MGWIGVLFFLLVHAITHLSRSVSLVHARAFSFSDDSINVDFSSSQSDMVSLETMSPFNGPHSTVPSKCLLRLRQLQSTWYQELFQSPGKTLPESREYRYHMCDNMTKWAAQLAPNLAPAFRDFFDLELYYSYVYCLAPTAVASDIDPESRTVIFEYCIAYVSRLLRSCQEPAGAVLYTYHDSLKIFFVATQFVELLTDNLHATLNGTREQSSIMGLPPLPLGAGQRNYERSIHFISNVREVLRLFGLRWDNANSLLTSFTMQSDPLLESLYSMNMSSPSSSGYGQAGDRSSVQWSGTSDKPYESPC